MKVFRYAILFSLLAFSLFECSRIKETKAEKERAEWIAGFNDSIDYYQQRIKTIDSQLELVNSKINNQLLNFELISNPREVEGYYLLKGWKDKIPFTSTAVYARINLNEKLEVIATLSGETFNRIAVYDGPELFYSQIVPHDQAFNFRHQKYNTVYFDGGKADTIASLISQSHLENIELFYFEGDRKKKSFRIPENEKDMIYQTYSLFGLKKEASELQKELWISSKKIDTFRRLIYTDSINKSAK